MKKLAPLLVCFAGILWGMIGLFVRRMNDRGFSSLDIVSVRALVTTLILFLVLGVFKRELFKIKLKDLWCFLGTGICSILFFNFCYFKSIETGYLAVAAILLYTAPAFVLIFSAVLFHEKITKEKIIQIVCIIVGCALATNVFASSGSISLLSVLFGIGSGIGYALYSIFGKFAIERGYKSATITFYTFLIAGVGTLPFVNLTNMYKVCVDDSKMLGFYFLFGLVSTVLPYIAYSVGLKDMDNSKAAVTASVEPITASLLGFVVFGENISGIQILGIVLALGAVVSSNIPANELLQKITTAKE